MATGDKEITAAVEAAARATAHALMLMAERTITPDSEMMENARFAGVMLMRSHTASRGMPPHQESIGASRMDALGRSGPEMAAELTERVVRTFSQPDLVYAGERPVVHRMQPMPLAPPHEDDDYPHQAVQIRA